MSVCFERKTYTEQQAARLLWDVESVMDLMNRRVYYQMTGRHRQELEDLWVAEPEHRRTASLGSNYGYYQGMGEVIRFYVTEFEAQRQQILSDFCAQHPEIENIPENRMIGYTCMMPNSTPLVEVAQDGQTAQGIWYTIAQETVGRPGGHSEGLWRGEKIAADFVREGERWKIWHLVVSNDYFNPAGTNHSDQPLEFPEGQDPRQLQFGSPTIPMLTHDSRLHWADNYPPEPQPYHHYEPGMGYGPEGWRTAITRPAAAISQQRIVRGRALREQARKRPRPGPGGPGGPGGPQQDPEVN